MSSYQKKMSKKQVKKVQKGVYFWLPMMLMIGVVPLIVRAALYNPKMKDLPFGGNSEKTTDFFLYNKSLVITVLGTVLIGILVVQLYMRSTKDRQCRMYQVRNLSTPFMTLIGAYVLLAVLSTLTSEYRAYSIRGSYEQFESMWVVLMYGVIAIFCYLMLQRDEWKPIVYTLMGSAFVVSIIGSFQTWGKDFFSSSFGRSLITWGVDGMDGKRLTMKFGDGVAYSTLYNPNYIGSYVALLLPLFIAVIVATKKLVIRILAIILSVLMLISLYGSGSLTGELAVGASILIGVLGIIWHALRTKGFWETKKNRFIGAGVIIILAALICFIGRGKIADVCHSIFDKGEPNWDVQRVVTTKDDVELTYKGEKLHITMDNQPSDGMYVKVTDEAGEPMQLVQADDSAQTYTLTDEKFKGIQLLYGTYKDLLVFAMKEGNHTWTFSNQSTEDGSYRYYNAFGKWIDLKDVDASLFETNPSFADNRGFLWSRTLPLLKNYVLLGSGPDTFTFVFPNVDYVGMVNSNYVGALVTKPHNMYLQIAVQSGMVSLLIFLAMNVLFIISTVKTLRRRSFAEMEMKILLGILIGIIGYLIAGLANDSTITVAPIYWALVGTGMAFNRKCKE